MKHIKSYENINDDNPQIGDYVICEEQNAMINYSKLNNFFKNNPGKIKNITDHDINNYVIEFYNVPKDLYISYFDIVQGEENLYTRPMSRNELIVFSKNIKDLEFKLSAKKYNL